MTDLINGPSLVPAEPCLADDLLRGAEEIAEFMFNDRRLTRRVYHIAATSRLPHFKLGALLCARKSKLMRWIEEQEARNSEGAG
ncbi:MAG: DNA-binding protein [Bradyrhizobium sp.]|nr:DNA-binding protein [Bradyrhizobium sp.]